jgi:hypothetical protein
MSTNNLILEVFKTLCSEMVTYIKACDAMPEPASGKNQKDENARGVLSSAFKGMYTHDELSRIKRSHFVPRVERVIGQHAPKALPDLGVVGRMKVKAAPPLPPG